MSDESYEFLKCYFAGKFLARAYVHFSENNYNPYLLQSLCIVTIVQTFTARIHCKGLHLPPPPPLLQYSNYQHANVRLHS